MQQKEDSRVFQFRVSLSGLEPQIWRRIQVPGNYSFWDLHVAIQDSMGWLDYHLHDFLIEDPASGESVRFGIPDEFDELDIAPDWEYRIADYFTSENPRAIYLYDYGDCWEHEVLLERILPRDSDSGYPKCLAGERACPPEDCGGIYGYQRLLEVLGNPLDEEHEEMAEWLGAPFDSEAFDPDKVRFDDPKLRWKRAFQK